MVTQDDWTISDYWSLFKAILVIGGIAFIIIYAGWFAPECTLEEEITNISSLDLENQLSGNFILGIGSITEKPQYYFYKQEQGGMLLDYVSARYTVIEERNETPRLIKYHSSGGLCKGYVDIGLDVMVVPIGTVKRNYDVNLNSLR